MVFARRHMLDTSLEQCVGRLSHDRTTVRYWQPPIFTPKSFSGTPRQPTPRLLGQLLCDYHAGGNNYSFDALQAYCFGINIKL